MDEQSNVSVVIPAYNSANTIARTIDSVLAQSYCDWEIIVVDDCSKDATREIVEKYSETDQRIHVIANEKNSGVAESRNRGVVASRAEWIAFLDSDDYWESEKLEQQFNMLQKYPDMKLCFTGSAFIDDKGNKSKYILHVPEKVTFEELLSQNLISCSSVLIKRNLMLTYPMIVGKNIHEDFVTWLKVLKVVPYAVGVNEPLLIYQISSGSKSGNKFRAARMQWNSYRVSEISVIKSIKYFGRYVYRNVMKYKAISFGNV